MRRMFSEKQIKELSKDVLDENLVDDVNQAIEDGDISTGTPLYLHSVAITGLLEEANDYQLNEFGFSFISDSDVVINDVEKLKTALSNPSKLLLCGNSFIGSFEYCDDTGVFKEIVYLISFPNVKLDLTGIVFNSIYFDGSSNAMYFKTFEAYFDDSNISDTCERVY